MTGGINISYPSRGPLEYHSDQAAARKAKREARRSNPEYHLRTEKEIPPIWYEGSAITAPTEWDLAEQGYGFDERGEPERCHPLTGELFDPVPVEYYEGGTPAFSRGTAPDTQPSRLDSPTRGLKKKTPRIAKDATPPWQETNRPPVWR